MHTIYIIIIIIIKPKQKQQTKKKKVKEEKEREKMHSFFFASKMRDKRAETDREKKQTGVNNETKR